MKLERISEKQIRCTLNKSDLLDRELRISELAYGTEKAKELFRDMMHQAAYELGFEVEDVPLVIEAIPISSECLMLVITKVDDPDELDTRFSKFSHTEEMLPFEYDPDENDMDENMSFEDNTFEIEIDSDIPTNTLDLVDNLFGTIGTSSKKGNKDNNQELNNTLVKVFSFHSLDELSFLGKILTPSYKGANTLYKNPSNNIYYLLMTKGEHTSEEFSNFVSLASEHGKRERATTISVAYFEEHYESIIKDNALSILASI